MASDDAMPSLRADGTRESVLGAPPHGQHVAQLYTEQDSLVRAVVEFAGAGLRRNEAVILVATTAHRQAVVRRLEADGFALADLSRRGQLTMLDASQTLSELLVGSLPDRERFQTVIGGMVKAARLAGYQQLRAFGEWVNLLRRTNLDAVLQIEEMWNHLVAAERIALLCGYSIDAFDAHAYQGLLQRVLAAHSYLVPVEDYARLDHAVKSAYAEVFGSARDAGFLRRAFLAHYARPVVMPDGQAAIFAAQEFVPEAVEPLLQRARRHYEHPAPGG
jgi:lambda repressor-like predicted transcriptional regulator